MAGENNSSEDYSFIASNIRDIEDYLRGFADGDELLAHYLCKSLTEMLARRNESLRVADEQDQPELADKMLKSLSKGLLGDKIIFDPAVDPTLDDKIRNIAAFVSSALKVQQDWQSPEQPLKYAPRMLSHEFLQSALQTVNSQTEIESAMSSVFSAALLKASRDIKPIVKAAKEQSETENADLNDTFEKRATRATELLDTDKDGWMLVRYNDYDLFYDAHRQLEFCLGPEDISREKMDSGAMSFYGLLSPDKKPQAMILTTNKEGVKTLTRFKIVNGALADNDTLNRFIPFIQKEGWSIANTQDTGLLKYEDRVLNVFELPDDVTNLKHHDIKIIDDPRPFTLNKLDYANDVVINNCPGFTSIGDLRMCWLNLNVKGCKNLNSLGNLKQVWKLNIKGTGITDLPESLKKVERFIVSDVGDFSSAFGKIGPCRRKLKKRMLAQQRALPGPS